MVRNLISHFFAVLRQRIPVPRHAYANWFAARQYPMHVTAVWMYILYAPGAVRRNSCRAA